MYLADYHLHTACSPDGSLTMAQIAALAIARGLHEICFTDHCDTVYWEDLSPRSEFPWDEAKRQFDEAQLLYGDRLKLKLGLELGESYFDFSRAEKLLAQAPALDFSLGSVHILREEFDFLDLYYIEKRGADYYHSVIDGYMEEMRRLIEWGHFHVLAHLTLPLRYINEKLHEDLTFAAHMEQTEQILRLAIEKGIGLECNTNRGNAPLPDESVFRLYRRLGGEIVTLGSDSHDAHYIGHSLRENQEMLRACGFRYFTTYTRGVPEFHNL